MADRDDVAPTVVSAAKRRMLRRLRSHWCHEQFSIRMALASAVHHSHMRVANMGTQTDFVPAGTYAATAEASQVVSSFLLLDDFAGPHVQPSSSGTDRYNSTAACYFFRKLQRFRLWSGYWNKLLSPSKCCHMSV